MKILISIILFLCFAFPAQAMTVEESIYLNHIDTVLMEMNDMIEGLDLSIMSEEESQTIQNELWALSEEVLAHPLPEDNTATWDLLSYSTAKSCESLIVCFEAYDVKDIETGLDASDDSMEYASLCIMLLESLKERG